MKILSSNVCQVGWSFLFLLFQGVDFFQNVWVLDVVREGIQQSVMVIERDIYLLLLTHRFVPEFKLLFSHPIEVLSIFFHLFDLFDPFILVDFSR